MSRSELDRRLASRLECRIPVRLSAGNCVLHAETLNLSRVGVLLRVPLVELGLDPGTPLGRVGEMLGRALGDLATAEFRYDALGGLVCRTLRMVRIADTGPESQWVEVGCALRRPLRDEEANVLSLPLPPLRFHPALDVDPTEEVGADEHPAREIRVVLCAEPGHHARPMAAKAVQLSAAGVRAVLDDLRPLPGRASGRGLGTILSALSDSYGVTPWVLLMRNGLPLWSGSARIQMVETSALNGDLNVQLDFVRDLSVPELAGLGVA